MQITKSFLENFKKKLFLFNFFSFYFLVTSLFFQFLDGAITKDLDIVQAAKKLENIQSKINLIHGSILDEYPEQLMATMYIPRNAKVLELGANVGRNSCVIASIIKNSKNLVAVESSVEFAKLLRENRDANGFKFFIEDSAISTVPLIQTAWKTIESNEDRPGWTRVKTITYKELRAKYKIQFDTLVVDCEGALLGMLRNEPEILKNINLVIIENDFDKLSDMEEVQVLFKENGLQCVYNEPFVYEGKVCGNCRACGYYFYQVWRK